MVLLKVAAKDVPGFKKEAGKAAMWEVTFGSAAKHAMRSDSYSIDRIAGHSQGHRRRNAAAVGRTDARCDAGGGFGSTVDSDAAYQAAVVDAADFLKKNPEKPLTDIELGATAKLPQPFWYFVWGDSKSGGYMWWWTRRPARSSRNKNEGESRFSCCEEGRKLAAGVPREIYLRCDSVDPPPDPQERGLAAAPAK